MTVILLLLLLALVLVYTVTISTTTIANTIAFALCKVCKTQYVNILRHTNKGNCYLIVTVTNINITFTRSPSTGASISYTKPWSQPFPE